MTIDGSYVSYLWRKRILKMDVKVGAFDKYK